MKTIRTVVLACAAAALAAQEQGETIAEFRADLVVRVPEVLNVDLERALNHVVNSPQVAAEVVEAITAAAPDAKIRVNSVSLEGYSARASVIVPNRQALVNLFFAASGTPPAARVAADAASQVIRRHLDRVLFEPAAEECARHVEETEALLTKARRQREALVQQEAELGLDDAAAVLQTLFELKQQAMQAELELRTEQGVSEELPNKLAALKGRLQDAEQVLRSIDQTASSVRAQLNAGKTETEMAKLRQQLDEEQARRQYAVQIYTHTEKEVASMQEQVTASSLLLQRHMARRAVLREMVAEQQKLVDESAVRARERRDLLRAIERCSHTVDKAELELDAARERRHALQPVMVRPWN